MRKGQITNRYGNRRVGSALLVALLIMGVLITMTLGLSSLVIREIRQTADLVAAGKAYYAAEAGIEHALYDLTVNLPGYETGEDGKQPDYKVVQDDDLEYQYKISNKGDAIPFFSETEPIYISEDGAVSRATLYEDYSERTYNVLPLNGSVTIPLFVDDGGKPVDVDDFLIQYYVDFKIDPDFLGGDTYDWDEQTRKDVLTKFDILRWKVFGNPRYTDPDFSRTEAISDFFPASSIAGPKSPVCIGSSMDLATDSDYDCVLPIDFTNLLYLKKKFDDSTGVTESEVDVKTLNRGWSYARECYLKDSGNITGSPTGNDGIMEECTISSFIDNHQRNYVTLTNIINPDIVGITNTALRDSRANIYWRIVTRKGDNEPKLVRQFADIKADGYSSGGSVKQSIDAKVGMSSSLPVFNFSLYRTDTEDKTFSPEGYQGNELDLFGNLKV